MTQPLKPKKPETSTTAQDPASAPADLETIRAFLSNQDKSKLIDLLLDQSLNDDRLHDKLTMQAAARPQGSAKIDAWSPDLVALRIVINRAVKRRRFIDYAHAYEYSQGIEQIIDELGTLADDHPDAAIDLCEYALTAIESATASVDDSDGHMTPLMQRLQDIHLAACRKAAPDPEQLARQIFQRELNSDFDLFHGAAQIYSDILGQKGLAVYSQLAESQWSKIPPLGPGQKRSDGEPRRSQITYIMETLAKMSGITQELVTVQSRDLSHEYTFLEIAQLYKKEANDDLALEWAERGVRSFPDRCDARLRDFLAEEYKRRTRHDDALSIIWSEFSDWPSLHYYQKLKPYADQISAWPAWRQKALDIIRENIRQQKKDASQTEQPIWRGPGNPSADHSALVSIFLWEQDIDAAWHEATEGGCTQDLWLQLAALREKDHPDDAIRIYQNQIAPTLDQKHNAAYEEAVTYLSKIHKIMSRLGQLSEFAHYLESIRATYKRFRNFVKLLDSTKWS